METPVGALPREEDLNLAGVELSAEAREKLFGFEREGWRAEFASLGEFLEGFGERMPDTLLQLRERIASTL